MSEEIKEGYTRVTEILSVISEFPWIVKGIEDFHSYIHSFDRRHLMKSEEIQEQCDIAFFPVKRFKDKGGIGTEVHEAISLGEKGIMIPVSDRADLYYKSYLKWKNACGIEIIHSEQRLYCDTHMITGQVDAIARFPGSEELVIVDFKTSASSNDKIWPLQGMMYKLLANMNEIQTADRVLFVQLDRNGDMPKVHEYRTKSTLFNIVFSCISLYRYMNSSCK